MNGCRIVFQPTFGTRVRRPLSVKSIISHLYCSSPYLAERTGASSLATQAQAAVSLDDHHIAFGDEQTSVLEPLECTASGTFVRLKGDRRSHVALKECRAT